MALLSLRGVTLAFGGPKLLDCVTVSVERGDRLCLMGRNGEGKSTLLRLIHGEIEPDEGEVIRQQGLRISRLRQDVPEGCDNTVAMEISLGLPEGDGKGDMSDHRVGAIISRMRLEPELRFVALSSGMKRRTLLAQAIVSDPDILLLDEPTNHLDIDSIRWLEDFLLRYGGTLIFVTHDRVFLERLATRIVELDRGQIHDWSCDYPTFLKRREEVLAAEERQAALFDKRLAQEEVWIRKGVEARRTRNEGRVRSLKSMREMRSQRRDKSGSAKIQLQESDRSGAVVTETKDVSFRFEDRDIIRDLTTTIMRGDKVGIIGPNGAGKTTLLRLLLGQLVPESGTIRQGTNLEVAYFDQLKAGLDDERTVQQNVSEYEMISVNGLSRHVIGYLQDFLFPPERSRSLVRFLSGGERSRLLLAKLFTKPSNVLVLDEPTNDLDVETLELLEGLLVEYQGTILLVSHDRAFLNDVVTNTLVISRDGSVKEYDGGYDDYVRQAGIESMTIANKDVTLPQISKSLLQERPRKLSFKEQRELDALPTLIEQLETSLRELHSLMGDPEFYRLDRSAIAEKTMLLQTWEAELMIAYERWESLDAMMN